MSDTLARSIAQAEDAAAGIARFERLSAMDTAQLKRILGGDPAEAAPWIRAAAAHGVVEAQIRLGRMLLDGTGVPKDEKAAYRWLLRAARSGDADAMNMVGRCHENGWGASASDEAAASWYRRSAEAGHDWGQYNYAHMVFDGRGGVPLDRVAAFALYRRAASQGHVRAMNLVGRCLEAGWGVTADKDEAAAWYERSARGGYFRAQFNHAIVLIEQKRFDDAAHWLALARDAGDEAMGRHVDAVLKALPSRSRADAAAASPRSR